MGRASNTRLRHGPGLTADVGHAMLRFNDLAWLSESRLCELPQVQERARSSRALFAEGIALRELLDCAAQAVMDRLPPGDPRLERVRFTLNGVLQGQSIAALARSQGKSREYWSRTVWRAAVGLVTRELVQREKIRATA